MTEGTIFWIAGDVRGEAVTELAPQSGFGAKDEVQDWMLGCRMDREGARGGGVRVCGVDPT